MEELNEALFVETNPIPVKWALDRMGLIIGDLRLPLTPLDEQYHEQLVRALDAVVETEGQLECQYDDSMPPHHHAAA